MSFEKVRTEIDNLQHQVFQLKEKVDDIDRVILKKEKKKVKRKK